MPPPPVADNGAGIQPIGQPADGTPVIVASAPAPPPPPITPVAIPVADPVDPGVDVDTTSSGDIADDSPGDFGTPAGVGGDLSGGIAVADAGFGGDDGGDG